ncbi:MAG: hypothetical protein AB1500_09060 [Bacillota bacterium]
MVFDFRQIIGSEDSKHENFSCLCNRLLLKLFHDARPVEGKGGDEGVDTFIGEFNGECEVFHHKYFIDRVGPTQRKQIEKSLKTAINHHKITKWTLMLPVNLNPSELRWFRKLQLKYASLQLEWWGKTKIQELIARFPDLLRDFQPGPLVVFIPITNTSIDEIKASLDEALGGSKPPPQDVLATVTQDLLQRACLKVLIWGPGPSSGELYRKRCELRDRLKNLGHQADFSEDVWKPDLLSRSGLNLFIAEFLQAKSYDYVVCLMASPGSIAEVHDFARDKRLACKMMICVDSIHKSGYSAKGTLRIFEGFNGKIDWFKSADIQNCHLSTRVLEQLQKVAEAKQSELIKGIS